jgi:hypothetical protein
VGDYSVDVDTPYEKLIPTALVETALPDATPASGQLALVPGADGTLQQQTTAPVIKPGAAWHIGGGVLPGALSILVSGSTLTDAGGKVLLGGATQIGTIDYESGVISWLDACPDYGAASKTLTYTPAAAPRRVGLTATQAVTIQNQGYVRVITFSPLPAPGSLNMAYRANDQWYQLQDNGAGVLSGADSSHGTGSINYATGTAVITTGALADPDSSIVYTWSVPVTYFTRGGDSVQAPRIKGTLGHTGNRSRDGDLLLGGRRQGAGGRRQGAPGRHGRAGQDPVPLRRVGDLADHGPGDGHPDRHPVRLRGPGRGDLRRPDP